MGENTFDRFAVLFGKDSLLVGNTYRPLGHFATEILNLEDSLLIKIEAGIQEFLSAIPIMLDKKTGDAVLSAQKKLNAAWDLIFDLPFYRELPMSQELAYNLLPMLFSTQEKWIEVLDEDSQGYELLREFLDKLEYFPESLRNFRGQIMGMLTGYFEPLKHRNAAAYAQAYALYFRDMVFAGSLFSVEQEFEQSFPVQMKFVPAIYTAEDGGIFLAEQAEFAYFSHFLYAEFYRGLMIGNAPRQCQNCGRYFLLTCGYNTCYCNNIAPGETKRTCRKVGAHRKAANLDRETPAGLEYRKVYNRLKARKQRKKISVDEWNAAVAQAQEIRDLADRGDLSDEEMRKLFKQF